MNQPSDDQVKEWLTSPGCGTPFELTKVDVRGHKVNAWKHASASMRELWLDSRANFRKDYLIFIDNSQPLTGPDDQRIKNPAVKLTYADAHFQSAALAWTLLNDTKLRGVDRRIWSIVSIGCVAVPVNAWLPAEGQEYCLKVAECPVILCDGERLRNLLKSGTLDKLREKHGLRRVVSMFPESFLDELDQNRDPDWTSYKSWTGYSTFEDALKLGAPLARNQGFPPPAGPGPSTIDPDETSTLFFSSGTSGFPKGCVGTHRSYCQTPLTAMYRGVHAAVKKAGGMHGMPAMPKPSDPAKAQLLTTPLFHITATKSRLGGSTHTGGSVVFLYKWSALDCIYLTSALRISSIGGVPTMFYGIAEEMEKLSKEGRLGTEKGKVDVTCLTTFGYGGAPAPAALVDRLRVLFPNVSIGQGYGLTESSNNVSIQGDDYLLHPGSVGKLNPVSEMKIVEVTDWDSVPADHVDKEVPVGTVGELCFRGANVIKEYYKDPAATRRAFRGGWVHTGDLGYIDAEGFVYLVDRSKEMVIRGGENIYTVSIEEALYKFPHVWDAGAIGIPDPGITLGELPVGAVVLKPGSKLPTSEEVREFCRGRMAGFAVPVYVDVRVGEEGLPRNVNGKLVKRELREEILKRMEKEGVVEELKRGGGGAKAKAKL